MSLKIGEWKLNENGLESTLIIDKFNADTGEISGMVASCFGANNTGAVL